MGKTHGEECQNHDLNIVRVLQKHSDSKVRGKYAKSAAIKQDVDLRPKQADADVEPKRSGQEPSSLFKSLEAFLDSKDPMFLQRTEIVSKFEEALDCGMYIPWEPEK